MGSKKRTKIQRALSQTQSPLGSQSDHRIQFLMVLGVWCLVLWIFQFVTLVKFSRALEVTAHFGSFDNLVAYLSNPNSSVQLDGVDKFLFYLLIGLPAYMVYLQSRFRSLEGAWEIMGGSTWKKILFLSLLFASFCRFALHPGEFSFNTDNVFFLAGVDEFWRSLKMGSFANYSTLFYSGWNCRQYVGNLFSILAGTLAFFTDSHFGVKLLLWIAFVISGMGMFFWIEKLTRSRYASLFASVAFCLNYWHFHQIFLVGELHVCIIYACLPWPFYFFELGLAESRSRLRCFLLCAIPLAAVVYDHFVWGAMLWGLFGVYAVYRLVTWVPRTERTTACFLFAISIGLEILLLTGMITAPIVQKKESAAYHTTRNFEAIQADKPMRIKPHVLYQWYNGHWFVGAGSKVYQISNFNSYLGLIPLLFALLGLLGLSRKLGLDSNALKFISIFMVGSLALVIFYFELVRIPGISLFRIFPDYRYQTFVVFFASAGSAFGVMVWQHWVRGRFAGWKGNFYGVVPLLLLAVDVGATTFQFPFKDKSRDEFRFMERYKLESETYLQKRENVPYYFFIQFGKIGSYSGPLPGWIVLNMGMPADLGIQPQTAPRRSIFGTTFYSWLWPRLNKPNVFPDSFSLDYFYLNNFRDVILYAGAQQGYDTTELHDFEVDQGYVDSRFRHHSPIIASSTVGAYSWKNESDPFELRQLYSNMGLNYEHATAGKIFVQPGTFIETLPDTGRPVLNLLDYKVYAKKYFYHIQLNQPAYVRLAASYYSFLQARIDGQRTPFYPGATYEVVLKVPAGDHIIEVEGGWDPYRKVWLFITWIAIAVLGFLVIRFPAGFGKNEYGK